MDYGYSLQILPQWFEPLIQKVSDIIFKYPESILQYESTLQLLKNELEKKYEEYHWNNPAFCKAYLELYAAYRELRLMAKRDYHGEIDPNDERWIHFDRLKF